MPRLVVEPVGGHAGHRELVDLREPGVYRLPPVGADLAGVEGLVQVLAHLEPLHAAALRAVVSAVTVGIRTRSQITFICINSSNTIPRLNLHWSAWAWATLASSGSQLSSIMSAAGGWWVCPVATRDRSLAT